MPFVAVTFSLVPLLLPRPSRCHDNDSRPLVHASEQLHEEFGGSCRAGGPFSFPQGRGRIATVTFDLIPRRAPGLERLLPVTERVCLHPANDACERLFVWLLIVQQVCAGRGSRCRIPPQPPVRRNATLASTADAVAGRPNNVGFTAAVSPIRRRSRGHAGTGFPCRSSSWPLPSVKRPLPSVKRPLHEDQRVLTATAKAKKRRRTTIALESTTSRSGTRIVHRAGSSG